MSVTVPSLDDAKEALAIFDVYFRDETVTVKPELIPHFMLPEKRKMQFKLSSRILHDYEVGGDDVSAAKRFLEIEFSGAIRCLDAENEEDELLSMEVQIGLLYEVKGTCPDESIEEFVRLNAPYHAIPYWREHVHATCAKRRFPSITVPLYTHAPRLKRDAKQSSETPPRGDK
jgi:hypothetical protein